MKIIDEHTFEGKGYHPFLITDRWQVAYLNYAEAESLEQIEKLDIHHQTDEVFVLLQGKAAFDANKGLEQIIEQKFIGSVFQLAFKSTRVVLPNGIKLMDCEPFSLILIS